MKLTVIGFAVMLMAASFATANDYTLQSFQEQFEQASGGEAVGALCKDFMSNATDLDVVRRVQDTWEGTDKAAAVAFSKKLMEDNPGDARYVYLYGRVAEDLVEQVQLGRKAIELDASFPYGYRLVTACYINGLFNASDGDASVSELKSMLADDRAAFEKLAELDGDQEYAHRFLNDYYMYTGDYEAALAHLTAADPNFEKWPSETEYANAYAGAGQYDKSMEYASKIVDGWIEDGYVEEAERDKYKAQAYVSALREVKKYDKAIEYIKSLPGADEDGEMLYSLACVQSVAGMKSDAIATLQHAAANGWDKAKATTDDDDMQPLQDSPAWGSIMKTIEANWVAHKPQRREHALAQKISEVAPDWTLEDVNGDMVSLASLKGNVVVLDFWATWCGPCRMAMPELDKFTESLSTDKVKIFSVNVWERAGKERPINFMKENEYDMTLLFGTDELAEAYGVDGIPHILVIDQEGKIRYRHSGYAEGVGETVGFWTEDLLGSPVTKMSSLD